MPEIKPREARSFWCIVLLLVITHSVTAQNSFIKISPFEIGHLNSVRVPTGIWNYFDEPDSLSLTINYDNRSLVYLRKDTSKVSCVKSDLGWSPQVVQRQARFLGSLSNLYAYYQTQKAFYLNTWFSSNKKQPADMSDQIIWLSFEIGVDGKAGNPEVHTDLPDEFRQIMLTIFKEAPNLWLPALMGNREVPVKLTIPFVRCGELCSDLPELKEGTVTPFGKILFTVPRIKKNETQNTKPRKISFLGAEKKLGWSPDGAHILFQAALLPDARKKDVIVLGGNHPSILYRFSAEGKLLNIYFFSEGAHVICASPECGDFVVEFISILEYPLLTFFRSKYSNLTYPKKYGLYNPTLQPNNTVAAVNTWGGSPNILLWDIPSNTLKETSIPSDADLKPISWKDENLLLCLESKDFGLTNFFSLVNLQTGERKLLPFLNDGFLGWSPDRNKMLFLLNNTFNPFGQLYSYDFETNTETLVKKDAFNITMAFFGKSDQEVFYLQGSDLFQLNRQTKKSKKILSHVTMPSLNKDRTMILYFDEKSNGVFTYNLETTEKVEIMPYQPN
jgi:hypothetical protein